MPGAREWLTRPIRAASSPLNKRLEYKISAARAGPTNRGSIQVAPMPGWRPIRVKFRPSFARDDAMRTSQASATQNPAPTAAPLMAANVGQGRS